MYKYFIKIPWIAKKFFSSYIWSINTAEKEIYLTFDDGPHPIITPWVLDELKKYGAKATFFCIGNNVAKYPVVFNRIKQEEHAVGNHTYNHLNGWKYAVKKYIDDVRKATLLIESNLFRPPYGKIKPAQAKDVKKLLGNNAKIIMWDVLSADFDKTISASQCLQNVITNYKEGSIIVFHDSEKAYTNLKYVLPLVLENLQKKGFTCKKL